MFFNPFGLKEERYERLTDFPDRKSSSYRYTLSWDEKIRTATLFMNRRDGTKKIIVGGDTGITVSFTAGIEGTYIGLDGKIYVETINNSAIKELWNYIDPPLIYTPVKDTLVIDGTLVAGVKGGQAVAAAVSSGASLAISSAGSFGNLSKASEYGIKPYSEMRKVLKVSGL